MKLKNMFRSLFVAFVAIICAAAFVSAGVSSPDVSVNISMDKRSLGANDEVIVHVAMTNNSTVNQRILRWATPFQGIEGKLFDVTRDGKAVAFLGAIYKRPAPKASDYILLKPGQTMKKAVKLSTLYDMSVTGDYAVTYSTSSEHLFATAVTMQVESFAASSPFASSSASHAFASSASHAFANSASHASAASASSPAMSLSGASLQSQKLSLWIEGRHPRGTILEPMSINTLAPTGLSTTQCTSSQASTISSAFSAAKTMANGSNTYMSAGVAGTRYTTWFGAYSATRFATVKSNFVKIKDAFDTKAVVIDCSCTGSYYAYVYPNQPYKIYVCNAFWSAPMTGTDSKGGTLIHEMSHFDIVANTDDLAYGWTAAKQLAIKKPASAIRNADSHEYFSE